MKNGSKPPKKRITPTEKEFAKFMVETGLGPTEAARKVFKWKCEPGSSEIRRAQNLRASPRVVRYIKYLKEQRERETSAAKIFLDTDTIEWDKLRKYAFDRLEHIRDDPQAKAQVRFNAIQALKKLSDPSKDSGLILMWLNILWRGAKGHCPRCHSTFPLAKITNGPLQTYFEKSNQSVPIPLDDTFERRMEIVRRSDPRKEPHPGQIKALSADERHIAGRGAARAGKSLLLAWMALLFFIIPGVEIWILSRVYEDARSEIEYLRRFLNTLFYPYLNKIVKESYDTRTSELVMVSKWGSELRVRSAKSKGSITGRELEAAFVAEPGWVPEELYEELRARMSSRLGRIIMFGTPKGYGGILGRMLSARGRDETGRIIRISPEDRTLKKNHPWGTSLLSYTLTPNENPEYVKSELKSARLELLDDEYASEFEGLMTMQEGAKFPQVKHEHLRNVSFDSYSDCVFVLGIDQGPKNFAAVLTAYDGNRIIFSKEYFENDTMTMKHHMSVLMHSVPIWIRHLGGQDGSWKLTIFDVDPPLMNELNEFELEGKPWPTPVTFRPKNQRGQYNQQNWRPETYEYINTLAAKRPEPAILWNLQNCQILHDQVMQVQNRPVNPERDDPALNAKHWIVNDPWRGDHVLDAMVLSVWTILSNQLEKVPMAVTPFDDPYKEHKAAFEYQRRVQEAKELTGFAGKIKPEDIFREEFGRKRTKKTFGGMGISPYKDY